MAENNEERMQKTVASLNDQFNTIRTGRANAAIFDRVRVDYYGTKTPLNQVATIAIPEARSVIITPFDKSLITEIEKAISSTHNEPIILCSSPIRLAFRNLIENWDQRNNLLMKKYFLRKWNNKVNGSKEKATRRIQVRF